MAEKKPAAKGAAPKKKAAYKIASVYKIEGGKIVGRNPSSPKMGAGYFMAVHKDRVTCGSTGYMEKTSAKK
ncbi:MAG TPA: 30S ribosomal protein S27ae [Acidobacteriota bacterium]|nr:30S ribosomal protein S27ae [Acidobacteriota bacterium]